MCSRRHSCRNARRACNRRYDSEIGGEARSSEHYVVGVTTDREKQIKRDTYYMDLAKTVETGADCLGTKVGAVVALKNRVVSTGYNGTPEGFPGCKDNGCVRCHDSWLKKQGREDEMTDPSHTPGAALDRCVCVHAEQNAFITGARFGIALEGATLYTTQSPCFSCLKEAVQAGIQRIVYDAWYRAEYRPAIRDQYVSLYQHLSGNDPTRFEALGGGRPHIEDEGQPDAYLEQPGTGVPLEPPEPPS
jgi:dCMP deaminase